MILHESEKNPANSCDNSMTPRLIEDYRIEDDQQPEAHPVIRMQRTVEVRP